MATVHWLNRIGLAPLFALMSGAGAATLVAAMLPGTFALFTNAVGLGGAGRALAMLAAFVAVALPVWLATAAVERHLDRAQPAAAHDDDTLDLEPFTQAPAVAEPMPAAAWRPISADRELGAPLMSDEALRTAVAPPEPEPEPEPDVVTMAEAELAAPSVEEEAVRAEDNENIVGEVLAQPLAVQEFDLDETTDADEPQPGESSIDALIRRLETGLAHRDPPTPDTAPPQMAELLRSEINRAAPVAAARTGKPDDATARALQTLRQMAAN